MGYACFPLISHLHTHTDCVEKHMTRQLPCIGCWNGLEMCSKVVIKEIILLRLEDLKKYSGFEKNWIRTKLGEEIAENSARVFLEISKEVFCLLLWIWFEDIFIQLWNVVLLGI